MSGVDAKSGGVILIVDDNEDDRALSRSILERERYFILEANDGYDALDILRSEAAPAINLIILDLLMPCMSGWELLDVIRRETSFPAIPVLVTSGVPVQGDASGIGATLPWLRKPFERATLLAGVREAREAQCFSGEPRGRTSSAFTHRAR
jgi:two-component system response regulator ResD